VFAGVVSSQAAPGEAGMKNVHWPGLEALEARKLLSRVHVAVAHATPAAAGPIAVKGTLTVDNKGATTAMNADGSSTSVVPVSGQLGALGTVHGVWDNSVDAYGDYLGPDTLSLHNSKGSILLTFNDQNPHGGRALGQGAVSYMHTQRLYRGGGAYTGASESGTIALATNKARSLITSMTLESQSS
jgi:hypothetical protein